MGSISAKLLAGAGAPGDFAVDEKGQLIFSRNSSPDGTGTWTTQELDGSGREAHAKVTAAGVMTVQGDTGEGVRFTRAGNATLLEPNAFGDLTLTVPSGQ